MNYLHQVFYWKGHKTGPIHLNFSNDVWEYIVFDSFAWILSRSLDQIFSRYMKAWNLSAKQIDRFNIQCNNCTALVLDVPTDENISCILIWDLNNCRFASHTTWSFGENEKKILKEEQFLNCIFSKNLQIEIPAFKLLYVMYYKQFSRKKYLNGICHIKAQTYLFLMRQKITDFLFKRINC